MVTPLRGDGVKFFITPRHMLQGTSDHAQASDNIEA